MWQSCPSATVPAGSVRPGGRPDARDRAGEWSLGVAAFGSTDGAGRIVWQVDGHNGENFIRADGMTEAGAMVHRK